LASILRPTESALERGASLSVLVSSRSLVTLVDVLTASHVGQSVADTQSPSTSRDDRLQCQQTEELLTPTQTDQHADELTRRDAVKLFKSPRRKRFVCLTPIVAISVQL